MSLRKLYNPQDLPGSELENVVTLLARHVHEGNALAAARVVLERERAMREYIESLERVLEVSRSYFRCNDQLDSARQKACEARGAFEATSKRMKGAGCA
jgi:hypothetical protein